MSHDCFIWVTLHINKLTSSCVTYQQVDKFMCHISTSWQVHVSHINKLTSSCVTYQQVDKFMCHISTCSQVHVLHDHGFMFHMSDIAYQLVDMCHMNASYEWHVDMCHMNASYEWHVDMCHMNASYEWHVSHECFIWSIHLTLSWYVLRDHCVTWLSLIWNSHDSYEAFISHLFDMCHMITVWHDCFIWVTLHEPCHKCEGGTHICMRIVAHIDDSCQLMAHTYACVLSHTLVSVCDNTHAYVWAMSHHVRWLMSAHGSLQNIGLFHTCVKDLHVTHINTFTWAIPQM